MHLRPLISLHFSRCPRDITSAVVLLACAALSLTGCGSVSYPPPPGAALIIQTQPLSQTVPISQTATFTVAATGTAPLSYQWSENGVAIAGATTASYTTPDVALGANGSTSIGSFEVTVSDPSSSVTSKTATLTAGPRSPKAGDLRYLLSEQVDLPGLGNDGGGVTNVTGGSGQDPTSISATNAIGTPLEIGNVCGLNPLGGSCSWSLNFNTLPPPMTGLNMHYQPGAYSTFTSDMQSIVAANVVLDSLDFEPSFGAYAVSYVETSQIGGFDYRLDPIVPAGTSQQAGIQAQATLDGAASRIITAASFDASGNANLISYGWTGDTTTVYETQTMISPPDGVASAVTALAGEGYIISAFGGNDADGYIIVGMRIAGDTLPRPIVVNTPAGTILADDPDSFAYFTTVVFLSGTGGSTTITEQ